MNILKQLTFWHHFLLHPCLPTPLQLSLFYIMNEIASSHFSYKVMNHARILNFCLIPSWWNFNACCIYLQIIILGWFLNFFEIILSQKIMWVDFSNCFNFLFILHKVKFHIECTCPWSNPLFSHDQTLRSNLSHCLGGNVVSIHKLGLCFQFCDDFATHFSSH